MTQPSQNGKSRFNRGTRSNDGSMIRLKLVDGSSVRVAKKSIKGWRSHHGPLPGNVQVNSLQSKTFGGLKGSICLRNKEGDVIASDTIDFVKFAEDLLPQYGYTVTRPNQLSDNGA